MRLVIGPILALAVLAAPAAASAHGRSATVALDFRLTLSQASRQLPGVHVKVLDGDRDLQVTADPSVSVVVKGIIHEPFLRIDSAGVWANASSPTATLDAIVPTGRSGWIRLGGGRTATWHDHRLAPPQVGTPGPAGMFTIPVTIDGKAALIDGTFVRVARPSPWPWLVGALAVVGGIAAAMRRHGVRATLTVGLGVAGGVAGLVAVTTFAVRDAPTGGVAWLQVVTALAIAAVLVVVLVRLEGRRRVHAAGVIGGIAAAASLSSLSVFWHGAVVSALPGDAARAACGLALLLGAAAAGLSFLPDFDEPVRRVAR